jgi:uncharacterized membrane protein
MWNWIRKTLVAGLLVLAPISLSVYILYQLFRFFDGILKDAVIHFLVNVVGMSQPKTPIPGLGILAILALLIVVGAIARNYFGKKFISLGEYILAHIPLLNRFYVAIREISEAIFSEKREVFKKALLIEYPRKGLYSLAFFTQDTQGPIQNALKEDVISVFVPTAPNPTSGYLLFVPKTSVYELNMSVEDALKLVLSGGSVHLKEQRQIKQLFKKSKPTDG